MKNNTTVYYQDAPLDESQYPEIAAKFKIPFEVVFRCVEALAQHGSVPVSAFSGQTRERVRALSEALVTIQPNDDATPPAAPEDVLYDASYEKEETNGFVDVVDEGAARFEFGKDGHARRATMADSSDVDETDFANIDDPAPQTEVDEVISHAATGLMTAFSDADGCFLIGEDGCCRVNPAHLPTVEQSLVAVSNIMKLGELGGVIDDKSSWMLGSVVVALEELHGENFSVSQVCDETTKAYNTIIQKVGVFKAFRTKRYKVSYSHHQEAFYAKIPLETKKLILSKAESHKLGAKHVRSLCCIAKTMDDDTTIRSIRSQKMALDLIAAYRDVKVLYVVYNEGSWKRVTGLVGELPEGKIVIDTKSWTATASGVTVPIEKQSKGQ